MTDRVTQVPPQDVKAELLPQAVVGTSLEHLAARAGISLTHGADDLDGYLVAFLRLEQDREIQELSSSRADAAFAVGLRTAAQRPGTGPDPLLVMLQRYDGEPAEQFSIFLPAELTEFAQVDAALHRVLDGLDMRERDVLWRRQPEGPY